MDKYQTSGIKTMVDGAEITDSVIDWNGTTHTPNKKTVTLTVDYYSDVAQSSPTLSRDYDYVYTGDLDSFNTEQGWTFLLTLPQHEDATKI